MITEDYVSYETAKLLKEKWFDEKCISVYHDGELQLVSSLGLFCSMGYDEQILTYTNSECEWSPMMISAPTLQMAMKWLREVYELYIEISLSCDRKDKNAKIFDTSIFNVQNQRYKKLSNIQGYEEACEAAIRYCLENLI